LLKKLRRASIVIVIVLTGIQSYGQQQTFTYDNFPYDNWILMGFPAVLDNNDADAVLGPFFGTVGVGGGWRFSRWNIPNNTYLRYGETEYVWDANTQSYLSEKQEIGSPPAIQPGFGYWLVQQKGSDIDLSVTGTAINTNAPYYIPLDPPQDGFPGRNMVANPFPFQTDWSNYAVRVNYEDQSTDEMSLLEANEAGLMDHHAYLWDLQQHVIYDGSTGGSIKVWDGFWVEHLEPRLTQYVIYEVECEYTDGNGSKYSEGPDIAMSVSPSSSKCVSSWIINLVCVSRDDDNVGYTARFSYNWPEDSPVTPSKSYWTGPGRYNVDQNPPSVFQPGCHEFEVHVSSNNSLYWIVKISGTTKYACASIYSTQCVDGGDEECETIIKFEDAKISGQDAGLGEDGAIETDRFVISVAGAEGSIYARTKASTSTSDWIEFTEAGQSSADGLGFTIAFINADDGDYTFDAASTGSQAHALSHVEFKFSCGSNIVSPSCGGSYTATRGLTSGSPIESLELKAAPIEVNSQKIPPVNRHLYSSQSAKGSGNWIVPIGVESLDGLIKDTYNGFGMRSDASDLYDVYDASNLTPMLAQFIDLYFPHHDPEDPINFWQERPMKASYDVKANRNFQVYPLEISCSNVADRQFVLKWDISQISSSDWALDLYDSENDVEIDMMTTNEYSLVVPSETQSILPFLIVASTDELTVGIKEVNRAGTFALLENYPNPFNASTKIRFGIDRRTAVRVDIYSLTGERIRTLVNEIKSPGAYILSWGGTDEADQAVPSGVYLCRISTDYFSQTNKMLLLK